MQNHLSLVIALALVLLSEYQLARYKYHHHWCGVRLLHAIFFESLAPMIAVCLVYFDIFHTGELAISRRYLYLLSAGGAFFAHVAVQKAIHAFPGSRAGTRNRGGFPVIISNRITEKKLIIANQLRKSRDCRNLLLLGIDASPEISASARNKLRKSISQAFTEPHGETDVSSVIFSVIEQVGVAKMKLIVKGAESGEHVKAAAS